MGRRRVLLSAEARSRIMARIRGRNTRAEVSLRRTLWALGFRGYRVHVRKLPGTPDIVFPRHKVAVFVDGVFWHGHPSKFHLVRTAYWRKRIRRNRARDRRANRELERGGWTVVRLWDLEVLEDPSLAASRVADALSKPAAHGR
jgi:DNA mismatch endonuclease (patch repair protein)